MADRKEYKRKWYEAHRALTIERAKAYYRAHKAECNRRTVERRRERAEREAGL